MRRLAALGAALAAAALALPAGAVAQDGTLRAGVGRADITPQRTHYFLGGWTRADRLARGQHTRLFAKALVLERGGRKVALVAAELFMIPSGLHQHVAEAAGFDPADVLISATHTHAGPGGFANFPTYNTAAPSLETITRPETFIEFLMPAPADRQLYTFLVRQIATAIRRAVEDLGPAVVGWGTERIVGLTRNRSVEAHLADHGIIRERGRGRATDDPDGAEHTIDPAVDVLRVDKLVRRRGKTRRVPIGAWSNFANHGTVTKAELEAYNGDHHASAHRVFEEKVRRIGRVPASQDVVNVYGNGNEGDQSAGLHHGGPAGSDYVGRIEAAAMLRAWRAAGRRLSPRPALDARWTRACFCGRKTSAGGSVADTARIGLPFLTGSEEGRGPLYDITHNAFEGAVSAVETFASHGHKLAVPIGEFPTAAPVMVVQVGNRLIATLPGEPTKEVGARVRAALLPVARAKRIRRVVVAGLVNEYLSYLTTPEEYSRQHYEGGSTLYGPYTSVFLQDRLLELTQALVRGEPAPAPDRFDPTNGVKPNGPPYPQGAASGRLTAQPAEEVPRLGHAGIAWTGGAYGADRPVDRAFVVAERLVDGEWREVDSDLGLAMLWRVDKHGRYSAYWEVPHDAPEGVYRLRVTANRYELVSREFRVVPAQTLTIERVEVSAGRVAVRLAYPRARENVDLTHRPFHANGGEVRFVVDGREVVVRQRRGTVFEVEGGATVTIPAGAARDRHGNANREAVTLRLGA